MVPTSNRIWLHRMLRIALRGLARFLLFLEDLRGIMLKGAKKDLDTATEDFNPSTSKSIGNDFRKLSKSKKTNKVFMQKIGAAVA